MTDVREKVARALVEFGYALTMRGDWISDLWSPIWFHWWCPYPIIDDWRAGACIAGGHCGCDNSCSRARSALKETTNG